MLSNQILTHPIKESCNNCCRRRQSGSGQMVDPADIGEIDAKAISDLDKAKWPWP